MTGSPRIPRRAAICVVATAVAVAGAAVGALWAWMAPPVHGVVALTRDGERVQAYLGGEPEHFFVGPFLMAGLLGVLGVVSAAVAWQWRAHRGPGMVAGLSIGLTGAAVLAVLTGAGLVRRRYGVVDVDAVPLTPDHRVHHFVEAPPGFFGHTPWQIATTLLLPSAVAALVSAVCAAWSPRDDLGGYPGYPGAEPAGRAVRHAAGEPVSGSAPPLRGVTADGGAPPGR